MRRLPVVVGSMATLIIFTMLLLGLAADHWANATSPPNAIAASVDMDPGATPANTATSLGTIEPCAQIVENNIQDADEDAVDQIFVDVTVQGVPAGSSAGANGMIGYSYTLTFPDTHVRIQAKNTLGLMSTASGYSAFDASDAVPDTASPYAADVLDLGAAGVTGSGFLQRYTIETTGAVTP